MSAMLFQGRECLVVLGDFLIQSNPIVCITQDRLEKAKSGGDTALSVVPMDLY